MERIDLHVHSNHSDGTMTPAAVVARAKEKGLVAMALTDHDTTTGISEAIQAAKENDIEIIPGVELSCHYHEKEIHILGYYIDYEKESLNQTLASIAKERDNRNKKMCETLTAGGFPISYEELLENYGDAIITRAHFAKLLFKKGAVGSMDEAFRGCLNNNSPYYVMRNYPTPQEAIDIIKNAGGIPVLAHPLLYKMSVSEIHKLIEDLIPCGLKGIETFYSCNKGTDEAFVKKLAKDYKLIMTGGSDFHGENKPHIEIGSGMGHLVVDAELLKTLKELKRI